MTCNAAIPGRVLPSKNSNDAPPPVETCVTASAIPSELIASAVEPPPASLNADSLLEIAEAIDFVPPENAAHSNSPIGPFHTIFSADDIAST